jgi:single-strand DNA-binding protein
MGMFVNNVELIGNLGRDPEIRHTASGKKIATLSIATSESWKHSQSGEWRERTEWHRVVVFSEGLASIAEKHLEKGMKIRVEGKLRTRKWEDQSGQDRYSTEVHVENYAGSITFDPKRCGQGGPTGAPPSAGGSPIEPDDEVPV